MRLTCLTYNIMVIFLFSILLPACNSKKNSITHNEEAPNAGPISETTTVEKDDEIDLLNLVEDDFLYVQETKTLLEEESESLNLLPL